VGNAAYRPAMGVWGRIPSLEGPLDLGNTGIGMAKKIALTPEEQVRYKKLAEEFKRKSLWKKSKTKSKALRGFCPKCGRSMIFLNAKVNGHPDYCSKACAPPGHLKKKTVYLTHSEMALPPAERKRLRQIRRQERLSSKEKYNAFYVSAEWRELRYKVLRRFDFTCLACGRKPPAVVLHVDHIKPRIKYPELELAMSNLQVLCADCNVGKKHYFEDDLRPENTKNNP
jgi:5-methylcytosine-specific restriction endonuclease McrA